MTHAADPMSSASPVSPGTQGFDLQSGADPEPRLAPGAAEDSEFQRIVNAAVDLLRQGEILLGMLPAEAYARPVPAAFHGTIGGHYRHCLDHFTSLLRGLDAGLVDYDHRGRDPRLERDPAFALDRTRQIRALLEALDPRVLAAPVSARCEVSYQRGRSPVTRSSLGRELVYAIAHGIHHYALIAVMARLMGTGLPPHFGVAPSTLAHQAAGTGG